MIKKILMVCLGNVCRSPIAEAVMKDTLKKACLSQHWEVDSAGLIDEHEGEAPDHRSLSVLKKHHLTYSNHSRPIKTQDFYEFDYIFGMDQQNMDRLNIIKPEDCRANIFLLGDFGLQKEDRFIEDPYYESEEAAFEKVYQKCLVACDAVLKELQAGKI